MGENGKKPHEIFLSEGSANFWMRFSPAGQGQIRIGLKTRDEIEAEALASTANQKAVWQAEHSILRGKMSFDKGRSGSWNR